MKKKVSIGLIVIGLIALITGGVMTFTYKEDSNSNNNTDVVNNNKNNGEPIISEDSCDVIQTNKGYVDTELSSWCEEFHLNVDGLEFNFVKDAEGMFNLEVVYGGEVSYSSLNSGKTIYSDEQAGHTRIKKIDDLYFIDTAAAAQCGYIGSLIVVTSTGEFVGDYSVIDVEIDKDFKKVSYYTDPNNTCSNINNSELVKFVYTVNGTDFAQVKN